MRFQSFEALESYCCCSRAFVIVLVQQCTTCPLRTGVCNHDAAFHTYCDVVTSNNLVSIQPSPRILSSAHFLHGTRRVRVKISSLFIAFLYSTFSSTSPFTYSLQSLPSSPCVASAPSLEPRYARRILSPGHLVA